MINNVKFGACEGIIKPFGGIEKKESKSENNIIKVKNDMRRILRTVLELGFEISINQNEEGTTLYCNKVDTRISIIKGNDYYSRYEINSIYSDETDSVIYFGSQSSVINYIRNNS